MDYTSGPLVTAVGLACLLYSEYTDFRPGVWMFKPLASAGFLLTASPAIFPPTSASSSSYSAPSSSDPPSKARPSTNPFKAEPAPSQASIYSRSIFASLLLCALGDVLLIPSGSSAFFFQAGLFAFLLGHVGFAMAFAQRDIDPKTLVSAGAAQAVFGGLAWRWISPNLPEADRVPVALYTTVISAMGATAVGGAWGWITRRRDGKVEGSWKVYAQIAGALLFQVSDLFVARNQFVQKEFTNSAIGLPLYYAATTLLAMLVWP